MTHEQFVTLETARLAKQAGFDWKYMFSAPTQSVLQRWLREEKNIWVSVICDCAGDLQYTMYRAQLYDEKNGYYYTSYWDDDVKKEYAEEYPTYETALEAGLQECLTLICHHG